MAEKTPQAVMSFPSREERKVCWGARDDYWKCLDEQGSKDNKKDGPCAQLRKLYETACPSKWVEHFDRKRNYLHFKEKIEKQGYEPLDERSQGQ